jgi:hypothetical protein
MLYEIRIVWFVEYDNPAATVKVTVDPIAGIVSDVEDVV